MNKYTQTLKEGCMCLSLSLKLSLISTLSNYILLLLTMNVNPYITLPRRNSTYIGFLYLNRWLQRDRLSAGNEAL